MKYKAVIFDLDGTLVHTEPEYRYRIVGRVLKELRGEISNEYIDKFWFEAERDEIIKKCFGVDPELFWAKYREYDMPEIRKDFTKLYDDIDVIGELKERGYKLGIVTGSPIHIALFEIDMIGRENFNAIVVAQNSNGIRPKPHPHGLEECLDLLKVSKKEAVYVGNAKEDVIAAKRAGVLDIFIVRGEYEFEDITPSVKINSLYELAELLK